MKPNIALADKDRQTVCALLNALLCDEYLLYTKTRNYHWSVTGPQFHDLHKFFESQYEALDAVVDEIAERVRALGHFPVATMAGFLKGARLKEESSHPGAPAMLGNLLKDHEAVVRVLRLDLDLAAKHGDAGTSDFLTGLMERHEKMAWMLRAFLEGK